MFEKLWAIGLLRADRIRSNDELHIDGLQLVSEERGLFTYLCGRQIQPRKADWEVESAGRAHSPHPVTALLHRSAGTAPTLRRADIRSALEDMSRGCELLQALNISGADSVEA